MKKIDEIFQTLLTLEKQNKNGVTANEIGELLDLDRSNVSRYLNQLHGEKKIIKISGRPVLFKISNDSEHLGDEVCDENKFDKIVGAKDSLHVSIQQAKAAILYPPRGLHTLLLGETGVGKSMFAELMYNFAKESKVIEADAPFVHFNCADYAENPQLVMAQIFGVKKGAYTGADKDKEGLLKKAHGGILFLDEVHRLSPQGQEMLFTFIDKGYFRPLGETEKISKAEVQIIAATTEEPQSYLLKTFTRRIPMSITLPSLRDRKVNERYQLVKSFIREESKRVSKSIYINKNSMISFLLYECPNNIGQMKSDLQLACAKAFLSYKSKKENYILITQEDIPHHVRRGLMKIKEYRSEIDQALGKKEDILKFHYGDNMTELPVEEIGSEPLFYDVIEEKLENLKNSGVDDQEINQILNIDIESHFQNYIGTLSEKVRKEELKKIVDINVVDVVEEMLAYASGKLGKQYDEKIFFGLSLHLHSSLERIRSGNKIYHPKLNKIRINYEKEFMVAMEISRIIDKRFFVETPLDEIGYLTMFLASNPYELEEEENTVVVVVIMHGNATATSMVQVAKTLVNADNVIGLDMPLSMKAEDMYEVAKKEVEKISKGKGVLLLVDMGSLTNFGRMIYEDTGIIVKTMEMVSTPIVLEACRKADLGRSLGEIYDSCREVNIYNRVTTNRHHQKPKKTPGKDLIITACFTGEGASERLKALILDRTHEYENVDIISLDILNRKQFLEKVEFYKTEYRVLAIVGTVDIDVSGIPFISAMDMLAGDGMDILQGILETEDVFIKISESLKEHVVAIDGKKIVFELRPVLRDIESKLKVRVSDEVKTGIILHISFMLDKLVSGKPETLFRDLDAFMSRFSREMGLVGKSLEGIESSYGVSVGDNEIAYICKMFMENDIK